MTRVGDWVKYGWRVLEGIHTAVWLVALLGVSASSFVEWALHAWKPEYVGIVILAQALIWLAYQGRPPGSAGEAVKV